MNADEMELEELVHRVNEEKSLKFPPIFEMYITLFSISISILMFLFPDMLKTGEVNLYYWITMIMPQTFWAISFFVAGIIKSIGLLFDKSILRIIGLVMSAMLYLGLTVCYSINFPSIGTVTFACITVFAIISIPIVKHTGIDRGGK